MRSHRPTEGSRLGRDVGLQVAVVLTACAVLLPGLGATDLWAPDEPRYGQVAEELRSGVARALGGSGSARELIAGIALLRLNDEPYTQKPPLYYWLAALSGAGGGRVDEWAARLPSAVSGIACVLLTFRLARMLFGAQAGLWSALALLSVLRFGHLARRAQLDPLLCAFELGALLCFAHAERAGRARSGSVLGLHACLAGAVLTKGPVGLLPLLGLGVFLAWEGRTRELRRWLPARGLLLSLGPTLLWLAIAVGLAPAGFFDEAVTENLLGRFLRGTSHARPFYYYLYQLPLDFLPWTLLLPWAAKEARRALKRPGEASSWRLLLAFVGAFLCFFTLSAGKRGLYLLPVFPVLAVACGRTLAQACARPAEPAGWVRRALIGCGVALAGLGTAVALGPAWPIWPATLPWPRGLGVALLLSATLGPLLVHALRPRLGSRSAWATGSVAVLLSTELSLFSLGLPTLDREKSPRPIAEAASRLAGDGWIGVFDHRSFVGGAVYYARRAVVEVPDAVTARKLARGGPGVLIVRADRLHRLGRDHWELRQRLRSGRRAVLLLTPGRSRPPLAPKPPE